MITDDTKKHLMDLCNKPVGLGGWLGLPAEKDGCLAFVVRFYQEMGIDADENAMKQARDFVRVEEPRFGDVAVFRENSIFPSGEFHVAVMLDYRKAIQCTDATNGVGKIEVTSYPWSLAFKGFYRHRTCF